MRHMTQIADRAERRHFRQAIRIQQRDELIDDFEANTRMPVREIVDCRGHDRARFGDTQRRADAHRVAHQNIARQRALLGARDGHVAQRPNAGVHAIGANPALDDLFDEHVRRRDTRARLGGKLERLAGGDGGNLSQVERTIGTDHGHDSYLNG